MLFWKRPLRLDLSAVAQRPISSLQNLHYPRTTRPRIRYERFRFSLQDHWDSLGEVRWKILERVRMARILPATDQVSEFERYYHTIKQSSAARQSEVLIGLDDTQEFPLWIPRSVFHRHGYITGPTGTGKTARALTTLLVQLSSSYTDTLGVSVPPPAVVIFDFQPGGGDPFLHGLAHWIAAQRGQTLLQYTTDPRFESLTFAPWGEINRQQYPKAFAETMLKAFSLIHRESQDAVFFGNEQRYELERELCDHHNPPRSMRELIQRLEVRTRGAKGNREARGVHGALSVLEHAVNVELDAAGDDAPNLLHFNNVLQERRVLYIQLDSDAVGPLSSTLGKLMMTALLQASAERQCGTDTRSCLVVADEFQRLAAHNVVSMLEVARKMGVTMLLSHQTPASLSSENASMFDMIFDTVGFVQAIAPRSEEIVNALVRVSGRNREILRGGSTGLSTSTQESSSWNSSRATTQSTTKQKGWSLEGSWESSGSSLGSQTTFGSGGGRSEGQSHTTQDSWREEFSPGLTPELLVRANQDGHSLIFAPGPSESLTPQFLTPRLVLQLFPFTREVAERLRAVPRNPATPRPLPPAKPSSSFPPNTVGSHKNAARDTRTRSREERVAMSAEVMATMEQSIESLASGLISASQREWLTVQQFGRRHGMKTRQVLQLCAEAGHPLSGPNARMPGRLADQLSQIILSVLDENDARGDTPRTSDTSQQHE